MTTPIIPKALAFFAICRSMLVAVASSWAQEKGQAPVSPSSCTRENALEIIQQQIDLTRTFDNSHRWKLR